MMNLNLKESYYAVKEKFSSGPVVIYALTVILILLTLWFVINNFIFLTAGLNDAFGASVDGVEVERKTFDKQGFESLGFEVND